MELWGQLFSCLFCATLLPVIPFSERYEVISSPIVTGIVGQNVVLPCHIFTGTQPANMEVHWKKIIPAHEEIVHEYKAQTGQDVPGQKYQGRTELLKGGFTSGNVSLKLKNVQPSVGGTYICTVKSEEWNAEAVIELRIAESFQDISSPIVTGIVGQDVVLPCHISTGTQLANMEVHWKKIIPAHEEIVHEYRAQIGQDVPGQKYQGRTELLKDGRTELLKGGFTSGNVSLKLKNVQPSDGGTYICTVKSEEWNAEAVIELRIAELKNGETLKEKEKKRERRRAFTPETFENSTETPEKSTEKMVVDNLALQIKILIGTVVLIYIILIGIIFFICCCLKKKSEDPEKGRLISGEEDSKKWKPDRVQEVEVSLVLQRRRSPVPEVLSAWQKRIRGGKEEDYIAELQTLRSQIDELQIKVGGKEKHNEEELQTLRSQVDELQIKVDWTWTLIHSDNITLNPYTAHPNLSISEDKKKFTHEPQPQEVPLSPERFDSTVCVLGSEGFSFGKQCWEVDVRSSTDWDLGVARKATKRKGRLSLSPKEGFWVLGLNGRDYWAKTDPWTRIMVQKKPLKIGVYLSYQEEQVTFFNVTDMSVLFTFNDCSFSGEVCPFFKNSHKETTMRICSIGGDK